MPDFISHNISIINFTLINIALGLSIYLTLATGLLSLSTAGTGASRRLAEQDAAAAAFAALQATSTGQTT